MFRNFVKWLTILAILVAAGRLAYVASHTETGWSFIATQWQDATLGLIGLGHTSIGDLDPEDQAHFWIAEVDRIVAQSPQSSSTYMGASWILDSPDIGFMSNHLLQNKHAQFLPQAFAQLGLELDEEAISSAKATFREMSQERCLELAAKATQLDESNVNWWRMRALLQFEGDCLFSGQDFGPRTSDWLDVLQEGLRHDPENALYDYLAALQLWKSSADYEWEIDPNVQSDSLILSVSDADTFASGTKRFLQGQEKSFLAIGEEGYPGIEEFLEQSSLRLGDRAKVAVSRLVTFRQSLLFSQLWRWQNVRTDDFRRSNDNAQVAAILKQNLRLFDQAVTPQETSALNLLYDFGPLRRYSYEELERIAKDKSRIIGQEELIELRQHEEQLRIDETTLKRALQNSQTTRSLKYPGSLPELLSFVTSKSAAGLLVASGILLLLARVVSKDVGGIANLGVLRQAVAWTLGCGGSFFIFGMAPAEMISHETQRVIIVSFIWIVALSVGAAVLWGVVRLLRTRRLRFRILTLLMAMTVVLAVICPLLMLSLDFLAHHPPELWLHAKGWSDIDPEVLRNAMQLQKGSLYWASLQWIAQHGVYYGLIASLIVSAIWFMWRRGKEVGQGFLNYWTRNFRAHWSGLFRFVGRSAFIAAICWSFAYLCVAPAAIRLAEADFQYQITYCRDPIAHWNNIHRSQTDIESSEIDMKPIREAVRRELYGGDK